MNRQQLRDKLKDESVKPNAPHDGFIDDATQIINTRLGGSYELGSANSDTNEILAKFHMVYFYAAMARLNEWAKDFDESRFHWAAYEREVQKINVSNRSGQGWSNPAPAVRSEYETAVLKGE